MNIQLTVLIQAVIMITVIVIAIRLIFVFFRIAKSLEGIDETLYQIHNKLEDKNKSD